MLTHLSERVGVGEPKIAAVKVVAIGIGIAVMIGIGHPLEPHIRDVVKCDRKRMVFRPDVRRTNIQYRVVLELVEIGTAPSVLIL